jgi:hypothetical protein
MASPADRGHRPEGLHKSGLVDPVSRLLGGKARPHRFYQLLISRTLTQWTSKVTLVASEQAVPQLPVAGEPYSIAC